MAVTWMHGNHPACVRSCTMAPVALAECQLSVRTVAAVRVACSAMIVSNQWHTCLCQRTHCATLGQQHTHYTTANARLFTSLAVLACSTERAVYYYGRSNRLTTLSISIIISFSWRSRKNLSVLDIGQHRGLVCPVCWRDSTACECYMSTFNLPIHNCLSQH
eukprot:10291-Heterococcus_DN1.PRE.2